MTESFQDKFNRADAVIGPNYTVPCGNVRIFDEAVLPIKVDLINGSEVLDTSLERAQVLYTAAVMDGPDQVLRAVWGHDNVIPAGVSTPPSFTILARATKDPLILDLTPPDESPDCFDQFYGLRVTCPLDGSAPILKIIKKSPFRRAPNLTTASSGEPDDAEVLASVTIIAQAMQTDPTWDGTGNYPYRGFWQDMRLRIRRGDNEVILEAYLNDRYLNGTILTYTDHEDPLWSTVGVPGFEFLSAVLTSQPTDASPFAQDAAVLMRCSLFQAQTVKDIRRPHTVQPSNLKTYGRVVSRVVQLIEKNGEAVFTSSNSSVTKRDLYLEFVMEAEMDIIRTEGYFQWLKRTQRVYLVDEQLTYELPEDVSEVLMVRPGNFVSAPLREMDPFKFHQAIAGRLSTGGKPSAYIFDQPSPNNRMTIRLFPAPLIEAIGVNVLNESPYLEIDYYARQMFPSEPDTQIPFVPQEDIDVLIYGAAMHAAILDTDEANSMRLQQVYGIKLGALRRKNNRKLSGRQTVAMSAADIFVETEGTRVPQLRATQLQNFLP